MTSVSSVGSKLFGSMTKAKPAKKLCEWFQKDPEKALAYSTIASVAIKDGIGCGMYVYQSLHNDKIPEERRKFVSALDLTNGILMIVSQIGMFFAMRKINDKLFPMIFSKSFGKKANLKPILEQARVAQRNAGLKPDKKFRLEEFYNEHKDNCFATFKFITELAAATILAKRVLVPFIATPLAKKVEKKMDEKAAAKAGNAENNSGDKFEKPADVSMKGSNGVEAQPVQSSGDTFVNTNLLAKYKN